MNIEVTPRAAQWFIKELDLVPGDTIRFFGKVYGTRDGFSFGMVKESPTRKSISTTVHDIEFYIERSDEWFFNHLKFTVDYDPERNEPSYHYETL